MKYKFEKYNYLDERDNLNKSTSIILIENEEKYGEHFSTEIKNLKFDYLNKIVVSLEQVLSGELEYYDFGYEVYSIECKKETSFVIDTYDDWKCISEITTQEIYDFIRDWRNYIIEDSSTLINNEIPNNDLDLFSDRYTFFDGLKLHNVINEYDNWLSSTDYSVWNNSYIEIQNKRIYIIKENVKVLSTFRYFDKIELEKLATKYNFKIKEEKGIYYAYSDDHSSRQFEISENEELAVIYCMEGGNMPESIFIYGVFEK
ncbi:hypothetical protein [Flavobacterium piscisymbiosum]|uniref:Immunity protein 22 of polymorphic toxin system n=1 Tax=Flavobacterium piscisymbiosum TaxID=2893753 RepID=A0ABS8MFD6_9FLAO|nr:hypothetical protein [Flavobacterium sp. F-30]MCC9064164.1 hypothetical protein [Flavobacterium sp. F-30]